MSKHRHSKDKLYLTYSEHQLEWGGKKENKQTPLTRLPFDHCSLALEPFQNPVAAPDGCIFDIINIVPFLRKYKRHPITGGPLRITELVNLFFHKNEKGEYHDPISFKIFTDHTKLVAIKPTGNVYTADTVEELNRKPKHWKDLLTGEPFTYKDIIVLQDPKNIEARTIKNFDYLKNNLQLDKQDEVDNYVNLGETGKKIVSMAQEATKLRTHEEQLKDVQKASELEEVKKKVKLQIENKELTVKEFLEVAAQSGDWVSERYATEHDSVSVTSSQLTLRTKPLGQVSYRNLTEDEIRKLLYERIRKSRQKGYVQLITNFGNLNLEIHADLVPKTSENFLELCEKNYYAGTKFYKLVENEVLEGGDPSGTGYGGESIFGKPFKVEINNLLTHSKAGILSMVNLGPTHQTSQFFITLAECKKFDGKYAVFGEVVGGYPVLYKINQMPTNMWQRPKVSIKIKEVKVMKNPFRDMIAVMMSEKDLEKQQKQEMEAKSLAGRDKDSYWLDEDGFQVPKTGAAAKKGLGLATDLIQQFSSQEVLKKQLRKQYNFDSWL